MPTLVNARDFTHSSQKGATLRGRARLINGLSALNLCGGCIRTVRFSIWVGLGVVRNWFKQDPVSCYKRLPEG